MHEHDAMTNSTLEKLQERTVVGLIRWQDTAPHTDTPLLETSIGKSYLILNRDDDRIVLGITEDGEHATLATNGCDTRLDKLYRSVHAQAALAVAVNGAEMLGHWGGGIVYH